MGSGREPLASPVLSDLIGEGYQLFESGTPFSLGVCTCCCMAPEVERRILGRAPRDIPLAEIREWTDAAFSYTGLAPALRWLLPRILELVAQGEDVWMGGNAVALRRLAVVGYPDGWSAEETAFLERVAVEIIGSVALAQGHGGDPLHRIELQEALCMIALGGIDVAPALARLDALPDDDLARALATHWTWPNYGIYVDAFWEDGAAKKRVFEWLTDDAMLDRMLRHGTGAEGDEASRAQALCVAEAILKWREWTEPPAVVG